MRQCIAALLFLAVFAGTAGAQITGSSHDFKNSTTYTWNTTGEICVTCHAPHNAAQKTQGPLWNHAVSTASYTMYDNTSTGANKTTGTQNSTAPTSLGSASKICMACHDGSVGLGNFGGTTTNTTYLTGSALLGTALDDDHPISITYNSALATADGELADPSTTNVTLYGASTPQGLLKDHMLYNDKIECASCHDVHNKSGSSTSLLKKSNSASALCLTCHTK
ncbi:MAG: cytochrome C [Ignavibacteriae bacterium]|nr:cytochrome C [Ignavibacteriota bacterium]